MRYRAELRDPTATRESKPQQAFSNSAAELEEWAIQTLATLGLTGKAGAEVVIFQTIEKPYRTVPLARALDVIQERVEANAAALAAADKAKRLGMPTEPRP